MSNKNKRPNQKALPLRQRTYPRLKQIVPRNAHQNEYLDSIEKNVVTVGLGPAGSGKTYLAAYMAMLYHFGKEIKRVVVTRPAVEAGGEKLVFLPGGLDDKMDPYMRPIYDSFIDLTDIEFMIDKIDRGYFEICPLAFMRGRTFNNCIVILDEAQNASLSQLKMVLTRIGENCKVIIDGDPGQSDLTPSRSGLHKLTHILKDVPNVGIIEFDRTDIVRSQVVVDIVNAFEEYENEDEQD
jgi:phosphate starvation-inducible PhoH-like protein